MFLNARVSMKVCGESVSKRATHPSCITARPLWILILVVKNRSWLLHQQQDKALARRARGGADRIGRRTLLRERRRRGPMARLEESRDIPTRRRLLACHLGTVAVAWKGPFQRCGLYYRARCRDHGWWRVGGGARSGKKYRTFYRVLTDKCKPRHSGGWRAGIASALHPMPHMRP